VLARLRRGRPVCVVCRVCVLPKSVREGLGTQEQVTSFQYLVGSVQAAWATKLGQLHWHVTLLNTCVCACVHTIQTEEKSPVHVRRGRLVINRGDDDDDGGEGRGRVRGVPARRIGKCCSTAAVWCQRNSWRTRGSPRRCSPCRCLRSPSRRIQSRSSPWWDPARDPTVVMMMVMMITW
jgi:hypothetical protein